MRVAILGSVALLGLTIPAAALAQTASRSAEQIVCEIDPEHCSGEKVSADQLLDRPAEAGFSIKRPTAKGEKAAAVTPTPSKVAVKAKAPTATRTGTQVASKGVATAEARAKAPAPRAKAASGIDMRITFGLGSAEMTAQGRAEAEQFAKAMALPQLADKKFLVEGHTDAIGDRDYNLKLSQERAEAVATYLRSLGVEGERLQAKGYGFEKPLPNTPRASASNRRVQFVPIG